MYFPSICPYIGSAKSRDYNLVIFQPFIPFFGPFLGTIVKSAKKNVAPGNSLNFQHKIKPLSLIFRSLKCVFPRCTFSGPQLNRLGLVWYFLNSSKAYAPRGLDDSIHYIVVFEWSSWESMWNTKNILKIGESMVQCRNRFGRKKQMENLYWTLIIKEDEIIYFKFSMFLFVFQPSKFSDIF